MSADLPDDATAGDLDPERAVIKSRSQDMAHLADADCTARYRLKSERETTAATLWDDTPICAECLGDDYRDRSGGVAPVVVQR
jgi:hypothetical protein